MRFVNGFEKLALGDHNNMGREFKHMDTEPQSNVGPGGMAPTGIPSYQPLDTMESSGGKSKKKRMSDIAATQFLFGKLSTALADHVMTGSSSDISNAVSEQLKWTTDNGSDYTDAIGDRREKKALAKKADKVGKAVGFRKNFEKNAEPVKLKQLGHALVRGLKSSGDDTVKSTLKMQGLKHLSDAVKKNEGIGKTLKTQEGRTRFAEAFGKAVPSIAAAGAYGVVGKKVYDKVAPKKQEEYYYSY